jgi:regulator of sigma E protease
MPLLVTILKVILLIAIVVTFFNIIIFVHELGHFLAAKWRGLKIDRFQIWFGKPIWKKEIKGVQYGLGWIPAGGFVALPQMAPMEALEGSGKHENLPPVSPLDKIIVAFAGPLFSMLLALLAAVTVWGIGKPADFTPTQVVGEVVEKSPAETAGIQEGDKIVAINGNAVNGFAGSLNSIFENIVLSKGKEIEFTIERPGTPGTINKRSAFKTADTRWFQRGGLREVGIIPEADHIYLAEITKGSPAEKAGFKADDELVTMNGQKFKSRTAVVKLIKSIGTQPIDFEILRNGKTQRITVTPVVPVSPSGRGPMLGIHFSAETYTNQTIVYPGPFQQIADTVRTMWVTINRVVAPDSSIGVGHLSGPVGIGSLLYQLLQMEDGWRRIIGFMVLFNVNLAILNMMPFPVLDGGHIVLAILEKITGRPVKAKPLEILQTVCALALISLMLFVTSKDIGDKFGHGDEKTDKVVFPE